MNIDEVRLLIKQLGKELYADTPERQARGPFSVDTYEGPMTKEQKLADVEAYQAEMVEKEAYRDALMELEDALVDASPSVGEKLIANFLNLFPMGKRSSTGIGSLLGKEIGGMTEAEAGRIKDIEQEMYKLNSIFQKEGRGLKEIESLKAEKEGIMSMLGKTPLTKKTLPPRDFQDIPLSFRGKGDELPVTFLEEHGFKQYDGFGSKANTYELYEDKIVVYDEYIDSKGKVKLAQKTFRNPTLGALRKYMGYKAGGLVMNYGDYGRSYI